MITFKKKNKQVISQNLQQIQQEFNQSLFELGNTFYRKHMIKEQIAAVDSDLNALTQKLDKYGIEAAKLRDKIQSELKTTIQQEVKDVKVPN